MNSCFSLVKIDVSVYVFYIMDEKRDRITFHLDGRKLLVDDCVFWYDLELSFKLGQGEITVVSALEVDDLVRFWGVEFLSLLYMYFSAPIEYCRYCCLDVYLDREGGGGIWIYILNKMVYRLFTEPLDRFDGSSFFRDDGRIQHLAVSMYRRELSYPFVLSVDDLLETKEMAEEALHDLISWNPKVRGHSLFKRLQKGVEAFSKFMVG